MKCCCPCHCFHFLDSGVSSRSEKSDSKASFVCLSLPEPDFFWAEIVLFRDTVVSTYLGRDRRSSSSSSSASQRRLERGQRLPAGAPSSSSSVPSSNTDRLEFRAEYGVVFLGKKSYWSANQNGMLLLYGVVYGANDDLGFPVRGLPMITRYFAQSASSAGTRDEFCCRSFLFVRQTLMSSKMDD